MKMGLQIFEKKDKGLLNTKLWKYSINYFLLFNYEKWLGPPVLTERYHGFCDNSTEALELFKSVAMGEGSIKNYFNFVTSFKVDPL